MDDKFPRSYPAIHCSLQTRWWQYLRILRAFLAAFSNCCTLSHVLFSLAFSIYIRLRDGLYRKFSIFPLVIRYNCGSDGDDSYRKTDASAPASLPSPIPFRHFWLSLFWKKIRKYDFSWESLCISTSDVWGTKDKIKKKILQSSKNRHTR